MRVNVIAIPNFNCRTSTLQGYVSWTPWFRHVNFTDLAHEPLGFVGRLPPALNHVGFASSYPVYCTLTSLQFICAYYNFQIMLVVTVPRWHLLLLCIPVRRWRWRYRANLRAVALRKKKKTLGEWADRTYSLKLNNNVFSLLCCKLHV